MFGGTLILLFIKFFVLFPLFSLYVCIEAAHLSKAIFLSYLKCCLYEKHVLTRLFSMNHMNDGLYSFYSVASLLYVHGLSFNSAI